MFIIQWNASGTTLSYRREVLFHAMLRRRGGTGPRGRRRAARRRPVLPVGALGRLVRQQHGLLPQRLDAARVELRRLLDAVARRLLNFQSLLLSSLLALHAELPLQEDDPEHLAKLDELRQVTPRPRRRRDDVKRIRGVQSDHVRRGGEHVAVIRTVPLVIGVVVVVAAVAVAVAVRGGRRGRIRRALRTFLAPTPTRLLHVAVHADDQRL
mmetsp:Transcript_5000/g.18755  ORF Transcript_5000/g.18755 Transcript_5000/m.18755 type:complete len:211 (-) Transcript_5000:3942-4574(-)